MPGGDSGAPEHAGGCPAGLSTTALQGPHWLSPHTGWGHPPEHVPHGAAVPKPPFRALHPFFFCLGAPSLPPSPSLIPVSDSASRLRSLCNLENILLTFLAFKEHNYILISYSRVIIPDTESFECRSLRLMQFLRYSNEEPEHERVTPLPNLALTFGAL